MTISAEEIVESLIQKLLEATVNEQFQKSRVAELQKALVTANAEVRRLSFFEPLKREKAAAAPKLEALYKAAEVVVGLFSHPASQSSADAVPALLKAMEEAKEYCVDEIPF